VLFLLVSAIFYEIRSLPPSLLAVQTHLNEHSGVRPQRELGRLGFYRTTMDNMPLAELQTLSFATPSRCSGLLDTKYWIIAIQASGNTTVHWFPVHFTV